MEVCRHAWPRCFDPECWALLKGEDDSKKAVARRPKQVTDFHTWLQCFALYSGVLGRHEPNVIPELMAYMITISRAIQDFYGLAWVRYDSSFRRNAAVTGNRKWSAINPSIYSFCFTGKAAVAARCDLCLSTGHETSHCPLQEETDPEPLTFKSSREGGALSGENRARDGDSLAKIEEVCNLFNNDACRYKKCKCLHQCSNCGGKHKAIFCPMAKGGPGTPRQPRREGVRPY